MQSVRDISVARAPFDHFFDNVVFVTSGKASAPGKQGANSEKKGGKASVKGKGKSN